MQDRQHRAVAHRVEELVRMPGGRERPGLGLAVADDAGDDQIRVVERRAVGVRHHIAELAAFVDRARRFGRRVARDAAGKRELLEQLLHPFRVQRDVRVELAVRALEPGVRHQRRPAVARAAEVDHVQVVALDRAVQVRVDEVQARRRSPMPEQARLHMLERERLLEQRVVEQIDLPDREVVRRAPVGVEQAQFVDSESLIHASCSPSPPHGIRRREPMPRAFRSD